jgi:methylated-DNA-[protein]-cysteine S-methyltransferase
MDQPLSSCFQLTPLGWLKISGSETGLSEIAFLEEAPTESEIAAPVHPALVSCTSQLTEYFNGTRQTFELQLNPNGTGFQQKVWEQLKEIPFGKTRSYLDVALSLGEKTYTRAVGSANGKNPLAIVVPCHRVIGANGTLTGYAGGLWRKKWLLQFESKNYQGELFPA